MECVSRWVAAARGGGERPWHGMQSVGDAVGVGRRLAAAELAMGRRVIRTPIGILVYSIRDSAYRIYYAAHG